MLKPQHQGENQRHSITLMAFISFVASFLIANTAIANETSSVRWNGFASAGVEVSDTAIPYRYTVSKTPNWGSLTRAGLNALVPIADNLDATIQFVAADKTDHQAIASVAMMNFRPINDLSLRVGRQQLPLWVMSDYLNVGHAMPWTNAPDEVYAPNPLDNLNGAAAAWSHDLGKLDFVAEVFGGQSTASTKDKMPLTIVAQDIVGTSLGLSAPFLTARAAYTEADVVITSDAFEVPKFRTSYLSFGMRLDYNDLFIMGEHARYDEKRSEDEEENALAAYNDAAIKVAQTGAFEDKVAYQKAEAALGVAKAPIAESQGWYGTLGYRWGNLLPTLTIASWLPKKDAFGISPQKSQAVGLRYDLNAGTALKFGYKKITVKDGDYGFFDQSAATTPDFDGAQIYSGSVDVVF